MFRETFLERELIEMRPHQKTVGFALAKLSVGIVTLLFWVHPLFLSPHWSEGAVAQTAQDQKREADRLYQEATRQYQTSQFQAALATFQRELVIRRKIGDRPGEGKTLNNIGSVYERLGQYTRAIDFYVEAMNIAIELEDRAGEAAILRNIRTVSDKLGQSPKP